MKKVFFPAFCILLTVGLFQACKRLPLANLVPEAPSLISVLPKDDEIPEWKREGRPFLASGLAELALQINGGAVFYIDRGVRESAFQDYVHEGNSIWISVELHRTTHAREADRLYVDTYAESPSLLSSLGDGGRALPNLIGAYAIEFRKGSVFAKLSVTDNSQESRAVLLSFARTIAEKLP